MKENYYKSKTLRVEELKHFPFESFADYQHAITTGKILDTPIAMDMARQWIMQSQDSPKFWRVFSYSLMILALSSIPFFLATTFITQNLWLLLFIPLSLIVFLSGSPMGRRVFPIHYLLIIGFVIAWIITGRFPNWIYWFPILMIYLSLNQLYSGSAKTVRNIVLKNEEVLCLFWKYHWMDLMFADGTRYSQRSYEHDGKFEFYEDIDKEWKDYIEEKHNTSKKEEVEIEGNTYSDKPHCPKCLRELDYNANFCRHCGSKVTKEDD